MNEAEDDVIKSLRTLLEAALRAADAGDLDESRLMARAAERYAEGVLWERRRRETIQTLTSAIRDGADAERDAPRTGQ